MNIINAIEKLAVKISKGFRLLVAGYRYEMNRGSVPLDFIKVLRLAPGDVLVVSCPRVLTTQQVAVIENQIKELLRGRNSVMVIDDEWRLEVVRSVLPEQEPEEK